MWGAAVERYTCIFHSMKDLDHVTVSHADAREGSLKNFLFVFEGF